MSMESQISAAEAAPVRRTVSDLVKLLPSAPRTDDAYLDAVEEMAQNQPTLPATPWDE